MKNNTPYAYDVTFNNGSKMRYLNCCGADKEVTSLINNNEVKEVYAVYNHGRYVADTYERLA